MRQPPLLILTVGTVAILAIGGPLTAQIYRPVQGVGLPDIERHGSEVELPGVQDLEHPAAPSSASMETPAMPDTSLPSPAQFFRPVWQWVRSASLSLWQSLTWWLEK